MANDLSEIGKIKASDHHPAKTHPFSHTLSSVIYCSVIRCFKSMRLCRILTTSISVSVIFL